MSKKSTTTKSCFSCGSMAGDWIEKNCSACKRNSENKNRFTCAIQSDLFKQWMGHGNEEIRLSSWLATQQVYCPNFTEKGKKTKRKNDDKQMTFDY